MPRAHLPGASLVLLPCGDGCDEWRGEEGFLSQLHLLWALKERQACNRWTKAQRPVWQELGEVALCRETRRLGRALVPGQACGGPGSGTAMGMVMERVRTRLPALCRRWAGGGQGLEGGRSQVDWEPGMAGAPVSGLFPLALSTAARAGAADSEWLP